MNQLDFPILTLIVLLPAVAAAMVVLIPKDRTDRIRQVGLFGSAATGILTIVLLGAFDKGDGGFQFVSSHRWIEEFGASWTLGVDGISLFLVVLTGILFPIALAGVDVHHDLKPYMAWMLVLEAGCMGSFLALDLLLFFFFFEITLVPMYFIIGGWGYEKRVYASLKFFLFTLFGSAFLLAGMLALVFLSAKGPAELTFDVRELAERGGLAANTAKWIFLAFTAAFAVKVPLFPVHTDRKSVV